MPCLSCHGFRSNQVRLWLSLLACNLANLWRRLVLPRRDRRLVLEQLAAAVQTRLTVAFGGGQMYVVGRAGSR